MKKTLTVLMVLCLALVAVFATGSKEANSNLATSYEELETTKVGTGIYGVDFSGKTQYKDEIIIATDAALVSLNPMDLNGAAQADYTMCAFDRLIYFNEDTAQFEPELATSWSWVDAQTFELKLRNDVKWTDGSKFTAADVEYTIEKIWTQSGTSVSTVTPIIADVEVVDDYTVRLHLTQPSIDLANNLADFNAVMLCKKAYESGMANPYSVTTGAWIVKDYVVSDHYTMERNTNYWGQLPVTKKLTIRYIPENSARLIALQNGEVDVCLRVAENEAQYADEDPNVQLTVIPTNTCIYFAFNTYEGPGADKNFRLALAHCLNKDDIIAAACNGYGTPAVTNWGKSTYGHDESFGDYPLDIAKAKEYLSKTSEREIDVIVRSNKARDVNALTVVQAQAKEAGITVNIVPVESATLSSMTLFDQAIHEGVVFSYGWAFYGDDAKRPYTATNVNKASIHNDAVADLVNRAGAEQDEAKRLALYAEVQKMNHEEGWYLPLFYSVIFQAIRNNVTGIAWGSACNDFTYACLPL